MAISNEIHGRVYGVLWCLAAAVVGYHSLPFLGLIDVDGIQSLQGLQLTMALAISVTLGGLKGLTVMRRAGDRVIDRIRQAPSDAGWSHIFNPKTGLLIASMMILGLCLRTAPYPMQVKVWVMTITYPAVCVALLLGALRILRKINGKAKPRDELNQMEWAGPEQKL